MKKITLEYKLGQWYQIGTISTEEVETIKQDIEELKNITDKGYLQIEDYDDSTYNDVFI